MSSSRMRHAYTCRDGNMRNVDIAMGTGEVGVYACTGRVPVSVGGAPQPACTRRCHLARGPSPFLHCFQECAGQAAVLHSISVSVASSVR